MVVAILLIAAGLVMPVHFQAIASDILDEAELQGEPLEDKARAYLRRSQTGPAEQFIKALQTLGQAPGDLAIRLQSTLEEYPEYRASGGPSPFFDAFYATLPRNVQSSRMSVPVAALLASDINRARLTGFLEASQDPTVRALLGTRDLAGWQKLYPVNTSGGAALDIAVLISALLAQDGAFDENLMLELDEVVFSALAQERGAILKLERFYFSILASGGRFNWVTLDVWARSALSLNDFIRIAPYLRDSEEPSVLYAAVVMSRNPAAVAHYLDTYPEHGMDDLSRATLAGTAALPLLLDGPREIYRGDWWRPWRPELPREIMTFAFHKRPLALTLVAAMWIIAGLILAVSIKALFFGQTRVHERRLIELSQDLVLALCLFLGLVVATEPSLLSQSVTEPGKLLLEFELEPQTASIINQPMDMSSIDQITVIVLLIFFVMQLIIYTGCLAKLGQVKRAPVSAEVRLRLLENEDNLFDTGLYVGLAGTVVSLLMLAMGVVQASLVAAYASTLFGIIFVALLKILHVRPLRRKIILEADRLLD